MRKEVGTLEGGMEATPVAVQLGKGGGGAPPLALIDGSSAILGVGSLDPPALGPPFPLENLRPDGHDLRPRRRPGGGLEVLSCSSFITACCVARKRER
jgi:hypothetical protein